MIAWQAHGLRRHVSLSVTPCRGRGVRNNSPPTAVPPPAWAHDQTCLPQQQQGGQALLGASSWPTARHAGVLAYAVRTPQGESAAAASSSSSSSSSASEGTSAEKEDGQRTDSKYTQKWELRYRELLAFKAEYGHCNVPAQWPQYPSLGQWLRYQRSLHAQRKLCPERKLRLKSAGVKWSTHKGRQPRQAGGTGPSWDDQLAELHSFHRRHGHCHVPRSKQGLHAWANLQRRQRREGKLGKLRICRLDDLGFDWEAEAQPVSREERWNEQCEALRAYAEEFGHCNVPQRYKDNPSLGVWVNTQRKMQAQGRLPQDRTARLDELNFQWSSADPQAGPTRSGAAETDANEALISSIWGSAGPPLGSKADKSSKAQKLIRSQCAEGPLWRQRLRELRMFRGRYGHCSVPERYRKNPGLAAWVREVRLRHSQAKLSQAQQDQLGQIGLDLNFLPVAVWDQWVRELADAVDAHGGVFRLHSVAADSPRLARWVQQQRRLQRRGLLTEERTSQLLAIGADVLGGKDVESYTDIWEMRFAELEVHAAQHGYALSAMPTRLQVWVQAQRNSHRSGTLSESRTELLDSAGFQWLPCWDTQFEDLMAYKRAHGDCQVPQNYAPNPQLGAWVRTQRRAHRQGIMRAERSAFLDALGFDWGSDSSEDSEEWDQHFRELRAFHQANGHCRPEPSTRLGRWVRVQMHEQCMGRLEASRKELLDGLGLLWNISCSLALSTYDQHWDSAFQSLRSYRQAHGHCDVSATDSAVDPQLVRWVDNQRLLHGSGSLSPSRAAKLTSLGFTWQAEEVAAAPALPVVVQPTKRRQLSPSQAEWDRRYQELCAFRERYGHCSPTPTSAERHLVAWVARQRMLYSEGGLLALRVKKLSAIGFEWVGSSLLPQPEIWEKRFAELVAFKRQTGHMKVPGSMPVLFNWMRMQRFLQAQGSLQGEQARRLTEAGFDLGSPPSLEDQQAQARWTERYQQLRDFREAHRHPNVTADCRAPAGLSDWVAQQKFLLSDGALCADREALLSDLGLHWQDEALAPDPGQQVWDGRYQELLEFKEKHGHCCGFSSNSPEVDERLGAWVRLQVYRRRQGSLPGPLINKLAEVGVWEEAWECMYLKLVEYMRAYGDCMVPQMAQHLQLHDWVQEQRVAMAESHLEAELVQKLDRLGFYWADDGHDHQYE